MAIVQGGTIIKVTSQRTPSPTFNQKSTIAQPIATPTGQCVAPDCVCDRLRNS